MPKNYISSMAYVHRATVSACTWTYLKADLTFIPKPRSTVAKEEVDGELKDVWRQEEQEEPILTYSLSEDGSILGVPIDYALNSPRLKDIEFEDRTVSGLGAPFTVDKLPDPNHPSAPPGQSTFFNEVLSSLEDNYTTLAQAPTGSGKTVSSLYCIGKLGVPALVIVPTTVLAEQWKKEAIKHLGMSPSDISILSAGKFVWRDKKIVISVIHSVCLKKWEPDFYSYFGFCIVDEVHRTGAREFSKVMKLFPSQYKLGMTATPNRRDKKDSIIFNYYGKPSVIAEAPALAATCYAIKFPLIGNISWLDKCRNDVKPMKWLSGLKKRNELLVKLIVRLYNKDRNIIVQSKFIDHLETLKEMLVDAGIPENEVGVFARQQGKKKTKVGKAYLEKVKEESKIILATYAMTKEGFDCPRLDAGVEALPTADNVQGIGRIRRILPGKRHPIWFSMLDLNNRLFVRYSNSRLSGFEGKNVTIRILKASDI